MAITKSNPLATTYENFPAALQAILAKLAVADLFSGDAPTVAEEAALVRDLITICGEVVAFKALSTHVNDTYTNANGDAIYAGDYNNDPLTETVMAAGQIMSPGQEQALCMFIRANLLLSSMFKVISYGQLIAYTHGITSVADSAEAALTLKLKASRKTQFDLSSQVTFGTTGSGSSLVYTAVAKKEDAFDSTSVSDLHYALATDAAITNSGTTFPQLAYADTTSSHIARLWLLTKVTKSTHAIRSIANLNLKYTPWTYAATPQTVDTEHVIGYTQAKLSKDTTTREAFELSQIIEYVISTTKQTVLYKTASNAISTFYLNKATALADGTLNGDALLSSFTGLPTSVDTLINIYGLELADLRTLGISLQSVYDYYKNSSQITPSAASGAGWPISDIVSVFSFDSLISNGTDFTYVPFSATDATTNRKLVDNFLTLYQSGTIASSDFRTGVNNRYRTLNQSVAGSTPTGSDSQRNAVISYLLYNMQYNPQTLDETRPYTTATKETAAFISTLLPAGSTAITHKSLFHIAEAAGYNANTGLPSRFNVNDLVKTFKYMPKEVRNNNSGDDFTYTDYNVASNQSKSAAAWSESLVLNTWGCDDIFASSYSVTDTQTGTTTIYYPVSIVSALMGSDGTRPIIAETTAGVYVKQNYDGIPYSAIVNKVGDVRVVSDVVEGFDDLLGTVEVSQESIAAVFDALNLTSTQAKQYIGKTMGTSTETVSLVTISLMANLSPYQRRALFAGIASAANQYSLAGLTTEQFLRLGYSSDEWSTYITGGNVSVNVSLYDLLSATEDVTVLDSDFYLSSTTVKRAIFHTLASRKALVKAFIPDAKDEDQEKIALAPFADIPRP